jgi:acyl transferase domain-containing protein
LYESQPVFRRTLDECAEIVGPFMDRPLLEVLFQARAADNDHLIDETAYTQPGLFAFEYALAAMWRSWGIVPAAVAGHSVGEYVAACVAGVFSLEDGLRLIAARGRLMQRLQQAGSPRIGMMAMAPASEAEVRMALAGYEERVSVAAINGPTNTVISGESAAVEAVMERLEEAYIVSRPLNTSHAFHSPLMQPMLAEFEREAETITYRPPAISLLSGVSGGFAGPTELSHAGYWRRHVSEPVRFAAMIGALWESGYRRFLEMGPHNVLSEMGRRCVPERAGVWLPSMKRDNAEWRVLLDSLAALYVEGAAVDWAGFHEGYAGRRIQLPTYPFERRRYWLEDHEIRPDNRRPADAMR